MAPQDHCVDSLCGHWHWMLEKKFRHLLGRAGIGPWTPVGSPCPPVHAARPTLPVPSLITHYTLCVDSPRRCTHSAHPPDRLPREVLQWVPLVIAPYLAFGIDACPVPCVPDLHPSRLRCTLGIHSPTAPHFFFVQSRLLRAKMDLYDEKFNPDI